MSWSCEQIVIVYNMMAGRPLPDKMVMLGFSMGMSVLLLNSCESVGEKIELCRLMVGETTAPP